MLRSFVKSIISFWTSSIRRQLILGIAIVHAILMSIFVYDMVERQTSFLHQQSIEQSISLAETLAANSTSWVLANDIIGIEEVVLSQSKYPSLKYAMLLNNEGKILGHTHKKFVGQYANDSKSKTLLVSGNSVQTLNNTKTLIDIAAPIIANQSQIGWARVALGQDQNIASLHVITRNGVLYTMIAIVIGIIFAVLMARGLTKSLRQLVNVSTRIQHGEHDLRVDIQRVDEVGQLAVGFNQMLDSLASVRRELVASEERFDLAMKGSNDGVWDWNILTNEVYYSPRWKAMVGYKDHELENQFSTFERLVHPDDSKQVMQAIEEYFSGKTDEFKIEFRMHHKDAHWEYILSRGYVVRGADGKPIRMTGTAVDITEQKHAEEQILKLNSELEVRVKNRTSELMNAKEDAERANRAKSEFLSNMSHELRTPMNAILGFSQILEADTSQPLSEDQTESVHEIISAGEHLLKLINDVLDLARIEAGKISVSLEPVSVKDVLTECVTLIKPLAEEKEITIDEYNSCNNNYYVLADRTRFKQVLLNLLSNAVKYNKEKGSIKISCESAGGILKLCIADEGAGLTTHEQEHLFIPFERLSADATGIEGSGIGLALSKRLMNCMNGDIGIDSEGGKGSKFCVTLPMSIVMSAEHKPPGSIDKNINESPVKSSYRYMVLYIEDNPANIRLIQRILKQHRKDIYLLTATVPNEGLELAQELKPGLILLDINLPDMDGYEVKKCLQANSETRNIPVVGVSANAMAKDIARSKSAGFKDYLTKPVDMVKLLTVIEKFLSIE